MATQMGKSKEADTDRTQKALIIEQKMHGSYVMVTGSITWKILFQFMHQIRHKLFQKQIFEKLGSEIIEF